MTTIGDRLWIWGHQAGSHNDQYNLPGRSTITPAQAARTMGIGNLLLIVYRGQPEPPFARHAQEMADLQRVVWSIVGDSSSTRNDGSSDLLAVLELAEQRPNVCGAIMDDFFHKTDPQGRISRYEVADLLRFADRLHAGPRRLDLWVVLYAHDLELPVQPYLEPCDVVTFWTWRAEQLDDLEANFERLQALTPGKRRVLGCYMWDYGVGQPMPVERMAYQCQRGLQWLREGRIEGMIFLASCICDLGLETVEWTRRWIADASGQVL
jgi:hypothetical protein